MPKTKLVALQDARDDVYELEVVFSGVLEDDELERGLGCVGYAFTKFGGEGFTAPYNIRLGDGVTHARVGWDSTKTTSDDWIARVNDVLDAAEVFVMNGTPIRTTNRAGLGTRGTRLIDGIRQGVEIYAVLPGEHWNNILTVTDSAGNVVTKCSWESLEKPAVWEYSYSVRSDVVE